LEDGATEKEEAPIDDTMEDADDLVCTKKNHVPFYICIFNIME